MALQAAEISLTCRNRKWVFFPNMASSLPSGGREISSLLINHELKNRMWKGSVLPCQHIQTKGESVLGFVTCDQRSRSQEFQAEIITRDQRSCCQKFQA